MVTFAFAFVLSGCGETPQTNVAKAGQSAAKEGDKPYQNDQFKGNREEWAKTLRSRADNQARQLTVIDVLPSVRSES